MNIHKEGNITLISSFVFFAIILGVVYFYAPFLFPFLLFVLALLFLFLVSFFRNPVRKIPAHSQHTIYAPADGKVVVIEKVMESEYYNKEMMMVSIFMSPLNVHINRNPIDAEVTYFKYHPGKYLAAWNPKASTENERTTIAYKTPLGSILMRQVAGALARRIVCYLKTGDRVKQGEDMGFIKFGSRVDVYLPLNADILVNLDQKVSGNLDVLASLPSSES